MDKRTLEAVRYLGYGRHAVDAQTLALIQASFEELDQIAKKRIVYRIFGLKVMDEERLEIEGLEIASKNLAKNMKGCTQVVMLGATLGIEVDMLMKRYSVTELSRTVVLQACAAAMLEEYLNDWQKELKEEMAEQGYFLRPRFSPGYGDFSILHQKDILRMLDCAKKIGLTMTDSSMLTPTKSVTAVIGLGREEVHCHEEGCESCNKKDCIYRRN
mgnify:FL=1